MYYFVSLSRRNFLGLASVWRLIVIVIILEGLKISEVEDTFYVEEENSDVEWNEVIFSTLYEVVAGVNSEDGNSDK